MSFQSFRQLEIRWIDLEPTRGAETQKMGNQRTQGYLIFDDQIITMYYRINTLITQN